MCTAVCSVVHLLTPAQPDGHKLHGGYVNVSTWDTRFHECGAPAAPARSLPHARLTRYAVERGAEHVAFVYDGLMILNVSLAAFPDAKFWEVSGELP